MVTARLDRLAILYGGHLSDTIFKDMWYYNLYTNMWQEVTYEVTGKFAQPPPLKDFTYVNSKEGMVLYGGLSWTNTDMTQVDADLER